MSTLCYCVTFYCLSSVINAVIIPGFGITVTLAVGVLDIVVFTPEEFQRQTLGLLGVFNGDQNDDLTTPDGRVLDPDSSEETIFRDFGQLCKFMVLFMGR